MSHRRRERWAATFTGRKELWELEKSGELALFLSKEKPNDDPLGRMPVYHVWKGDEWLYCGPDMQNAYRLYRKERDCEIV